ncbi:MAG TPA: T9SS type A sorting domain-containing protein [Aequorivita sp.]|nr:T9SS type A sorting domain-containing protein [Aequorivita sp.]
MKKTTKNEFSKKLAKYSALSLAIAGVADASGQVVYTDIDPDFYGGPGSQLSIDFNEDGDMDIQFIQANNGNYDLLYNYTDNGGVLTNSVGGYVYTSNVAYGDTIDAGAGVFRSAGELCVGPGYMYHQFCGTGEGYIAVQFEINGANHYGWVRVDVADSANYIVMDYAYESSPNTAITAGDQGLVGITDQNFKNFKHYISNSQLKLSANNAMQKISMHNMLGQEVFSQKLNSNNEVVDLFGMQTGVYIVTVSIEGASKTFKIVKN